MFFLAPFIVNALISVALSVAASLIQQMFVQDKKQDKPGVRGSIQTGGDNPLAFIMGRYATAGQLEYAGTWGNDGDTPNAFFTKVIAVSDLPVRGLAGLYVNGEKVTLSSVDEHVEEYHIDGKDHLWVRFHNGNQTSADPFLIEKFGSDPDRPWQADMIGRGIAYVVITALVNRELFSGLPDYLIEVDGIPLTDRRGGTAQHDNPIVGIDHLLGGVSYGGQWVYGPQSITAARRPLATWQPQMNKCDVIVDGAKAFRFGYEVTVDQEPHVVIGEFLKACEGRIAEIGGIYKPLVGGPDAPVASFTDEDIVITEGQTLEPFPGLEATFNGITATYPEPAEAWENKEAPPRYRSDLELLDDNRRLPFSTNYGAVPYPVQVQRLMRAAIEETRRFRKHVHTMPPEWWEYEPLDAVVWTSERNGYANKVFLITAQDDLNNGNQIPALQEQDPADYDWSSEYVLPWDVVPLVIARPTPQVMTGWNAAPYIVVDADSNARRPAIEVFWAAGLHDVRAVQVQVRESWSSKNVIFDGELPYDIDDTAPSAVPSISSLLPNTVYEVAGKYLPFSGRQTLWSNWLTVTTPNVRLGPLDVIYGDLDLDQLGEQAKNLLLRFGQSMREVIEQAQAQAVITGDQELANAAQFDEMRRTMSTTVGDLSASFDETITTAIIPMNGKLVSIADALTELSAGDGDDVSTARFRMTAQSGGDGGVVIGAQGRVGSEGAWRDGGWYLTVPNDDADPTQFMVLVDQFVIASNADALTYQPFVFEGGVMRVASAFVGTASIVDAAITTAKIADAQITSAKIGDAQITNAKIGSAAIQSANIADLSVGTIKVANGAITLTATDNPASANINGGRTSSASITLSGLGASAVVQLSASLYMTGILVGNEGSYLLRLFRNGTEIRRFEKASFLDSSGPGGNGVMLEIRVTDLVGSGGNVTYTAQVSGDNLTFNPDTAIDRTNDFILIGEYSRK